MSWSVMRQVISILRVVWLPGAIASIYFFSWVSQSSFLVSWDVSWGLHEARRLLAGGVYGKDFFEPSPPMFLYLYSLPLIFSQPFFIITFVLLELLYIYQRRDLWPWIKLELMIIASLALGYLMVICYVHLEYITLVLPIVMKFYYQGVGDSFKELLMHPAIIYCFIVIGLFAFLSQYLTYKMLGAGLFTVLCGFLLVYFLQRTSWYYHLYPAYSIAFLLMIFLYGSVITQKNISPRLSISYVSLLVAGFLFILFPFCYSKMIYAVAISYKDDALSLIRFMHYNAKHQPVYFLSAKLSVAFPAIDYAQVLPVSRFGSLSWVPGYVKLLQQTTGHDLQNTIKQEGDILINTVADEIMNYHPALILVDVSEHKPFMQGINFDYLAEFLQRPKFRMAWQSYQFLTTLDKTPYYKLAVYQRRVIYTQSVSF